MRPLAITVETWSVVVLFMHVIVEMVLSTLKRMSQVGQSIKVFDLVKLISLVLDHFQNNDEYDQYHDVSINANSSLQSSYQCDHFSWT